MKLLGDTRGEREVKAWADNVGGHYARKRRVDLLEKARALIVRRVGESEESTFHVEVSQEPETAFVPTVVPIQGEDGEEEAESWAFDEDADAGETEENSGEDGWDLDRQNGAHLKLEPVSQDPPPEEDEEDSSDAWGWNDEEEEPLPAESINESVMTHPEDDASETAWDEAWDRPPSRPPSPASLPPHRPPKLAKRLEKFTAKGKSGPGIASPGTSAPSSPATFGNPQQLPIPPAALQPQTKPAMKPSIDLVLPKPKKKETYVVSGRAKDMLHMVEDILIEGHELTNSRLFDEFISSTASSAATSSPGMFVLNTTPSVLDLIRALYPITLASDSVRLLERSMRFSNDCLYLSEEVRQLERVPSAIVVKEQLNESAEHLQALGEWLFDDTVVSCHALQRCIHF